MADNLVRIPRVALDRKQARTNNSLQWIAVVVLILDLAFLLWGVLRLILIAFPKLQIEAVVRIFQALAFTREEELDRIFEAMRRFFVLPTIDRFNILGDVILNLFITVLAFCIGFAIYKVLDLASKRLVS